MITGLAPSVLEQEDFPTLMRIMEMYADDLQRMSGQDEDAEFSAWKKSMGFE